MSLRIVLVGSGKMARTHANHWKKVPETQIVAVVTKDFESVTRLAVAENTAAFATLEEALESVEFDIVDICTPTTTHVALALTAAKARKNIFIEKPLARTVEGCDRIIAATEAAGVTVGVGHVVRFFPEFASAKKAVDIGAVGIPAAIRTSRTAGHPRGGWNNWFADPELSGGVLLDMAIHDLDWIRWCFGPVERVFAKGLYGNREFTGVLDYGLITLKLQSGALAHVTGSWAHVGPFRTTFEICGDAGMLEHDSAKSTPYSLAIRTPVESAPGVAVPASPMSPDDDPYYLELRHFTDVLLYNATPIVTVYDAREAVRISMAALESIETGKPVTLSGNI